MQADFLEHSMYHQVQRRVRAEEARDMIFKGSVHISDLLRLSFGTDRPEGLNLVAAPNRKIEIRSLLKEKEAWNRIATRTINRRSWGTKAALTVAFFMPGLTPLWAAIGTYLGLKIAYHAVKADHLSIAQNDHSITLNHLSLARSVLDSKSTKIANTLGYATGLLLQRMEPPQNVDADDTYADLFNADKIDSDDKRKLTTQREITALLHSVISNAYRQHNEMPLTPFELLKCLHAQGVDISEDVMKELQAADPTSKVAPSFYNSHEFIRQYSDGSDIRALNKAISMLDDDQHKQQFFFAKALPIFYGNLLQLWGDRDGLGRMGIESHNSLLRSRFYSHAKAHWQHLVANDSIDQINASRSAMLHVLSVMSKRDSIQLAHKLLLDDPEDLRNSSMTVDEALRFTANYHQMTLDELTP